MTAYTATQSGNWSDTATWGAAGPPGSGDTVTIGAFTVTVDTNTTVGTSPNDATTVVIDCTSGSSILVVASGVTFTIKGNRKGVNGTTFQQNAGSTVTFDNSGSGGSPVYTDVNVGFQKYTFNGSSGSGCVFQAIAGQTFAMNDNAAAGFTATYTTFRRISTFPSNNNSGDITIENCTFDTCARFEFRTTTDSNTISIQNNTWTDSTHATDSFLMSFIDPVAGSRIFAGNVTDKGATISLAGQCKFRNNFFDGDVTMSNATSAHFGEFRCNFLHQSSAAASVPKFSTVARRNYFLHQAEAGGNPHFVGVWSDDADTLFEQAIFEQYGDYGIDTGDAVFPHDNGNSFIVNVQNCIVLPISATGQVYTSGALITGFTEEATRTYTCTHNTAFVDNPDDCGMISFSEGSVGHAGEVAAVKSNLAWGNLSNGCVAVRQNGTVQGCITAANADYNWRYQVFEGDNGRGYDDRGNSPGLDLWSGGTADGNDAADAGVDAHGGTGDPSFVDSTRNAAKWCSVRGYGAQTAAAAVAALKADTSRIADLIDYVFGGFKVLNSSMRNAAHDGGCVGAANFHDSTRSSADITAMLSSFSSNYAVVLT